MARRRRNKPGILAKAPWQVNLPLTAVFAGVSYYHTEFAQFASAAAASLAAMPVVVKCFRPPSFELSSQCHQVKQFAQKYHIISQQNQRSKGPHFG